MILNQGVRVPLGVLGGITGYLGKAFTHLIPLKFLSKWMFQLVIFTFFSFFTDENTNPATSQGQTDIHYQLFKLFLFDLIIIRECFFIGVLKDFSEYVRGTRLKKKVENH